MGGFDNLTNLAVGFDMGRSEALVWIIHVFVSFNYTLLVLF